MTRDILVDTPTVSFGDSVATPPPPEEFHILFEWPLYNHNELDKKIQKRKFKTTKNRATFWGSQICDSSYPFVTSFCLMIGN